MSGAAPPVGRIWWSVLVVLLVSLLVPTSAAAPIAAELQFTDTPRLDGAGTWTADDGLLLLEADESVPPYRVEIEAERLTVTTYTWTETHAEVPPLYEYERHADETEETEVHEDARLSVDHLRAGAAMLFVDQAWTLDAHFSEGRLHTVRDIMASVDPREDSFSDGSPGAEDHRGLTQSHSEHRADQALLQAPRLQVSALGDLEFSLYEADFIVEDGSGAARYTAGSDAEVDIGPLAGVADQRTHRVTVVHIEGGHATVDWSGESVLVATQPVVTLDGALDAPVTQGEVLYDRLGMQSYDQPLHATGQLVLRPTAIPGAPVRPYDAINDPIVFYETGSMSIGGDADTVSIAQTPIANPFNDDDSLLAAGATGVGLLASIYAAWRWGPLAFWALYSRLDRGAILENATRAQIYDIICSNPGISARGVHELADASWGTVVHHLGKLEQAGYVAVAHNGRAKCFYENHGKWDGHQTQLALLTREKTRRIAEAIVAVAGRDQNALVERTDLPQSTVSYHLLKLEAAGLVTKERAQSATTYFSTLHLRNLLDRLGSLPSTNTPARTEVGS